MIFSRARPPLRRRLLVAGLSLALVFAVAPPAMAERAKPYDRDLLRLAELLGAVHYLRALCGADDGQHWRNEMQALVESEGTSALRRARLSRRFNRGFRSFQRTYRGCTPTARTAIDRFMREGVEIARRMVEVSG